MKDFPPLVWLTTEISIPKCILKAKMLNQHTGELEEIEGLADAIALHRIALGFRIEDIPIVPWPEHFGYQTAEGRELNETAREYGDNPNKWYVSEQPIDLTFLSSIWLPQKRKKHRLERNDSYLSHVRIMVALGKEGISILPAWMDEN